MLRATPDRLQKACAIRVQTASRLHFGLLSFGQAGTRQFGGAGAMIDRPGVRLCARPADKLSASGPLAARVLEFARRFAQADGGAVEPAGHFEVESAPEDHTGLGTGTQLGLAVAAALEALAGRQGRGAAEWAPMVGRGMRSAIGTYGFEQGGLLVDAGKLADEPLAPLVKRVALPADWRFVLVIDHRQRGLSGVNERAAFAELPAVPPAVTAELTAELQERLVPAVERADFGAFAESLYQYGHQAGLLFALTQGGAYADRRSAELVDWLRGCGVHGVGQSSWGPTIFAATPSPAEAEQLVARLREHLGSSEQIELLVAAPANRGATIERLE